jgi:hypothetical protein
MKKITHKNSKVPIHKAFKRGIKNKKTRNGELEVHSCRIAVCNRPNNGGWAASGYLVPSSGNARIDQGKIRRGSVRDDLACRGNTNEPTPFGETDLPF